METSAIQDRISKVVESSKAERARVRMLVSQGRRQEAEPEIGRLRDFTRKKIDKLAPPGAESIEGGVLDWQAVSFLPEGAQARRAVAYVEVNTPQASEVGSGFLVSPRLLLTCQHVIHDVAAARGTQITFDREMDELGRPRATSSYVLDPDTFALFSDETEFDYALVAVGRLNAGSASLAELGEAIPSQRLT